MNRNDMTMSFIQKLGFFPKKLIDIWKSKNNWIWFHAVSVGELNAVWPLILEINKIKPAYPIMISTTTSAGYKLATELCNKKGFLVFYKKGFPKIHDLTELVKLCSKIDKNFSKILKDADILSQYYLVVRYPTEYKEAGKLEAREAIETAKRIADFVKDIIKAQL